jgi:hypothetical protein
MGVFLGPTPAGRRTRLQNPSNAVGYEHCERRYENIVGEKNTITVSSVTKKIKKSTNIAAFFAESRPLARFFPVRRVLKGRDHNPTAHREDKHVAVVGVI